MFLRPMSHTLSKRLEEPRRFIQALIGPRQTGKTTVARQIIVQTKMPWHYIIDSLFLIVLVQSK